MKLGLLERGVEVDEAGLFKRSGGEDEAVSINQTQLPTVVRRRLSVKESLTRLLLLLIIDYLIRPLRVVELIERFFFCFFFPFFFFFLLLFFSWEGGTRSLSHVDVWIYE